MEAILPSLVQHDEPGSRSVRSVYLEHGTFIWKSLLRLGVREADCEDALQDVLVVVHRKLPTFDPARARCTSWLFGIALRVARNYRRRAHNRREVFGEPCPPATGREDGPERALERTRAQAELARILDGMSPVKRATFVMFELEGLSCEEIGAQTGVPVGTVHSRLHAARRDFERALTRLRAAERRRDG